VARYTGTSKDRVRDAVDFVELVSARTELRRAGSARYEGLCPFHEERTPSFGIDPVQKVYYCFGCQASGDVFTFVEDTEGVDFKGALELLADRYGVELERDQEDPREAERRRRRERMLELLARTAAYYERLLWESSEAKSAREYLQRRGLGEQILRSFGVGYAPSAWDRVLTASRGSGFSEAELYATGLVQRSRQGGQPYDRFRARIMFPLMDVRGRVLGFGARSLGEERFGGGAEAGAPGGGEAGAAGAGQPGARSAGAGGGGGAGGGPPKYLNTSDNEIYHKGRHLYGAHLARGAATRAGEVLLCEGYTDTIALHQAGIINAVGLMGTALTDEQVGELARMASRVLLALDADSAGQEAMLRAAAVAQRRKLALRVVPLPPGADPAELIQREGAEALKEMVGRSVPFVRFRVERILADGDHSSPEGRDAMLELLRPVFATLRPSAMRLELTRLVAGSLELPGGLAERLLEEGQGATGGQAGKVAVAGAEARGGGVPGAGARAGASASRPQTSRRDDPERAFLALCIASPEDGARALEGVDVDEHFASGLLRRAALHLRQSGLEQPLAPVAGNGGSLDSDPELKTLLAELVVQAGRETGARDMLEVQRLQLELARLDRHIQRAQSLQSEAVSELARSRAEVKRRFDTAYARVLDETGEREG
jgi:DNA primase